MTIRKLLETVDINAEVIVLAFDSNTDSYQTVFETDCTLDLEDAKDMQFMDMKIRSIDCDNSIYRVPAIKIYVM